MFTFTHLKDNIKQDDQIKINWHKARDGHVCCCCILLYVIFNRVWRLNPLE